MFGGLIAAIGTEEAEFFDFVTLSETLGKNVDLVIEDDLKPSLRQNILKDVIYL